MSLPYERLPDLLGSDTVERVYPSYTYRLNLNRGPAVIGATSFSGLTGARGEGVKVAVVDDGVDHEHPFLAPAGFSMPAGFPKGNTGSTTAKVIASRGFAGPGANSTPLDRDNSFHGTHVAGIIAGVKMDVEAGRTGFCIESAGGCHPAVDDVEGVAPRAYIGNYRVFNVPAPAPLGGCCSANSPEIIAAFEAAVRDGMDIINFSGGGPQADPRTDILIPAVANVVRAGVVPIISAGNDRDFFGLGTAGSPATAPDAISVGAVSNGHVFGPSLTVTAPGGLGRMPFGPADSIPPSWISADQRLVDVGTIAGVNRQLCDPAPAGSLRGAIALVNRGGCPYANKAARAREAGATGMVVAENRPGDPQFALFSGVPGGTISDLDGARIRSAAAGRGGSVTVRFTRDSVEVPTTWAGVPTSFTSSGLTPFGKLLKPDVTGAGSADPLVDAAGVRGRPVRRPRRDELLRAARRRCRGAARAAPSLVDAAADEVGADVDGRACLRRHLADAGGLRAHPGRRPRERPVRRPAADLHRSRVAVLRVPRRRRWRQLTRDPRDRLRRRWRRGHMDDRDPPAGLVGGSDRRGGTRERPARRLGDRPDHRDGVGAAPCRATTSASSSSAAGATCAASRTPSRSRARR